MILYGVDTELMICVYMGINGTERQLLGFVELNKQEICHTFKQRIATETPLLSHEDYPALIFKVTAILMPLQDLERISKEIEDKIPQSEEDPIAKLHNDAVYARLEFERHGNFESLSQAISKLQLANEIISKDNPILPGILINLGQCLILRFEHLGHLLDLNEATTQFQEAANMIPNDNPDKYKSLTNLGRALIVRYQRLGNLADIDRAVTHQQEALRVAPEDDPQKRVCFSNLATALSIRFEQLGDLADLDNGIANFQAALDLAPGPGVERGGTLGNLGNCLRIRYTRLGNSVDLDNAIMHLQTAVNLIPDEHIIKPIQLTNLGITLDKRFNLLNHLADIDLAIVQHRKAVSLTPDGHFHKADYLTNFGLSLQDRFEFLGDRADIDEAIVAHRAAVNLTPDGQYRKGDYLGNLAESFKIRFTSFREVSDINNAILQKQLALRQSPESYPEIAARTASLGESFWHRFTYNKDLSDAELAIFHLSTAAKFPYGPPSVRFRAAEGWIDGASSLNHNSLLAAYECAISLMPLVAWLGLSVADRHQQLVKIGGTVRDAAAAAIKLEQYDKALEWLEQGRSIVWTQILQLRTPVDRLHEVDPNLANRLLQVSRLLDRGHGQKNTSNEDGRLLEEEGRKYRALTAEWENIIGQVRSIPNFEDFLRPPRLSRLFEAAREGPVVVVNISKRRCDALALLDGFEDVVHIPLSNITADRVVKLRDRLGSLLSSNGIRMRGERAAKKLEDDGDNDNDECEEILAELWSGLVKPVLDSLAFSPHPNTLPRIWWCATGPLAFLPIHAAGIYNSDIIDSQISNYVVSSYTPTLSALLEPPNPAMDSSFRLLSVIEPSAPGASYIPNTKDELDRIRQRLVDRDHIILESADATKSRVTNAMDDTNWLHLACHGVQKPIEPTKSALLLHDGYLTLEEIIRLRLPKAEFAFLSACQTTTGDESLSEEAVHIAGGMLLAGYRSVVATMWSIQDELAPAVTDEFYAYIMQRKERPNNRMAAEALHHSVQKLRQRKEIPLTAWIPFVHLGI